MQPEQYARYSRQMILPGMGVEGQEKLRAAKVLIIGAGGLGSPAALYLAAAGVGTLGIADFDRVEISNLHRQILHDNANIGKTKLDSALQRLRALHPDTVLVPHPEGIQVHNALEIFSQYDIIVDGSDNFPTRYLNNDAAFLSGKPLVYGSIFQFEGQVSFFHPSSGTPCYRCLFPQMPPPGTVPNCAEAGVFGALCGVVGSWQALEAIKYITGTGSLLNGKLLRFDALNNRIHTIQIKPDPACPLCGKNPEITSLQPSAYEWACDPGFSNNEESMSLPVEIDIPTARQLLEQDNTILLDVREPMELQICCIPNSRHIPMHEVPEKLDHLPKDATIVVHCHHGGRSLRVTQFLRSKGYDNVTNLKGGINQWAIDVDPSMQRY